MTKPKPTSERKVIRVANIPGADFTTYEPIVDSVNSTEYWTGGTSEGDGTLCVSSWNSAARRKKTPKQEPKERCSYSVPVLVELENQQVGLKGMPFNARVLACRSYKNTLWSITLRCDKEPKQKKPKNGLGLSQDSASLNEVLANYVAKMLNKTSNNIAYRNATFRHLLGYCPPRYECYSHLINPALYQADPEDETNGPVFLNDIRVICERLRDILFDEKGSTGHTGGLLAITGATDSSKSLITRGLIFMHMEKLAKKARSAGNRKPHLITYEDPIEEYFIKDPSTKVQPFKADLESILDAFYIDYTPREKKFDARNLGGVTKDALRQTPAILFVGETRAPEDWEELIEFAGTGHLVITTSHSSSVVEAMNGIFRATTTDTAARRSEIARRILGIVNIRSANPPGTTLRALLPAAWKNTPDSVNNLIGDGLVSILPTKEMGYYGRTFFAKELICQLSAEAKNYLGESDAPASHSAIPDERRKSDTVEYIKIAAKKWDIEGV